MKECFNGLPQQVFIAALAAGFAYMGYSFGTYPQKMEHEAMKASCNVAEIQVQVDALRNSVNRRVLAEGTDDD